MKGWGPIVSGRGGQGLERESGRGSFTAGNYQCFLFRGDVEIPTVG